MGLRSPLVLDQDFSVGNTFGATGTPMAVLVDAEEPEQLDRPFRQLALGRSERPRREQRAHE